MKELTKIKLVNWHYFTNEEIEIKGSTLITGDNGSGKSTILDAIQYVLVADLRNVKFNVSAHDETKRSLIGYLRCKTGVDTEGGGQKFLRSGDITSYVALEFYDDVADEYFTVGAVIDSYRDNITYKTNFFKLERTNISDDLFFHGNTPRNIKEFRQFIKTRQGATVYPTNEQYREDMLVKMGSLSERFFSLFVKAISFKPIIDIRDFVYSYVLDERNVNIDTMRENFERYNHFLNLVKQTKEKILSLEEIKGKYGELQREMERAITHDYLIKRAKFEHTKDLLEETFKRQSDMDANLQRVEEELVIFQSKGDQLDEEYMSYREALASDTTYQMIRDLQNSIDRIDESLKIEPTMSKNDIESIYEEASIHFSENLLKTLDELEAFYDKLITSRKKRLLEQKNKLILEKKNKSEDVKRLQKELDKLMQYLGDHQALDVFVALSNRSAELKRQRDNLKRYQDLQAEYKERERQAEKSQLELTEVTEKYLKEMEPDIAELRNYFRGLAKRFYPNSVAGLAIENNDGENQLRFNIDAKIESDTSDGINNVKIFCYDLTVLFKGHNHKMDFIFHDSRLFDGIDERQKAEIFRTVFEEFSGSKKQYIATVNQNQLDEIKKQLKEDQFKEIFTQNVVLTLTDEDSSTKLLGISVDISED
jgi:energy-coupling factor transporter ATP-binding protein EcfA2